MSKWRFVNNLHAIRSVICKGASQKFARFIVSEITTLVAANVQDLSEHPVCKRNIQVILPYSVVQLVIIRAMF